MLHGPVRDWRVEALTIGSSQCRAATLAGSQGHPEELTVAGGPGQFWRGDGRPPRVRGGIALQGANRGMPGAGQQQRQVGAFLSGMGGEGRMAQLMQCPPGARLEQLGRPPIRQPRPPADRIQVGCGDRAGRASANQEDRTAGPAGQQAGGSWADPVCQNTHSTAPPLLCTHARRLTRSRSSTSRDGLPLGSLQVEHLELVAAGCQVKELLNVVECCGTLDLALDGARVVGVGRHAAPA